MNSILQLRTLSLGEIKMLIQVNEGNSQAEPEFVPGAIWLQNQHAFSNCVLFCLW